MKSVLVLLAALAFVVTTEARDNAALIVGGYWYYDDGSPIKDKAELFCDGQSVAVADYPKPTYLAGGVLFQDNEKVLICGGYGCDANDVCSTMTDCYWWNPTTYKNWTPAPNLKESRFNFLMASATHIDYSGQGMLPLSLGYGYETEIFNKRDNEWEPYRQLEDRNWYSMGCLIDYNGKVYSMRDKIFELTTYPNWQVKEVHSLPSQLVRSGKCAGLTIGGHPGIFSRYGYWYDMTAKNWTKKASPPVEPLAGTANVMWSFNGKPTIFGNPSCDDMGNCLNKKIVQYNPEMDMWHEIGEMVQPRIYQTVIEVPGEWCDSYGITEAPPTTSTVSTVSAESTTTSGVSSVTGSFATFVIISIVAVLFF